MKSSQPHCSLNMLTNTGGKRYIYILYKKTPLINRCHGNSSTSGAITQGHGCHCDVKLLQWVCLRPTVSGASAGSGSAGTWRKLALVHQARWCERRILIMRSKILLMTELLSRPVERCRTDGPPADGPPAGQTQSRPRTGAVVLNPQWWTETTEALFPPSPAWLIWPCFTLVTVLPICCLLALISQTASATAAATAVRFISCSICGCVISPLEKKKAFVSPGASWGQTCSFCNQSRVPKTTTAEGEALRFKLLNQDNKADQFLVQHFLACLWSSFKDLTSQAV